METRTRTPEEIQAAKDRMAKVRAARTAKEAGAKPPKAKSHKGNGHTAPQLQPGAVTMFRPEQERRLMPTVEELAQLREMAGILKKARVIQSLSEDQALAIMLKGWELDLKPMQALDGLYQGEDGTIGMRADLMRAKVQGSGVGIIHPVESTNERSVMRATRYGVHGRPDVTQDFEYTIADARRAGLATNEYWQKHPKGCLFSKTTGEAARAFFSDVLLGACYTPEELGIGAAATPAPVTSSPPSTATEVPPVSTGTAQTLPADVAPSSPQTTPTTAPVDPTPPPPAPGRLARARNSGFQVTKPDGTLSTIRTAGITRDTLKTLIDRTSARAGFPRWQDALAHARAFLGALGINEPLDLTEPEGTRLLTEIAERFEDAPGSRQEPAGTAPAQGELPTPTPEPTSLVGKLCHDCGIPEMEADVTRFLCSTHEVTTLAEIPGPLLQQALSSVRHLARDPQALKLMVHRALSREG